jgi:hypothetical protein
LLRRPSSQLRVRLFVAIFYCAALHKRIFTAILHADFGIQQYKVALIVCKKKINIFENRYIAKVTFERAMEKEKEIKKNIENSINLLNEIDGTQLRILLNEMSFEEIKIFWDNYSSSKIYSEANIKIPHWRTKDQERYILGDYDNYRFHPKNEFEKNKEEIIEHVLSRLKRIIKQEVDRKLQFKNQPLLKKVQYYLIISRFILFPFLIVFGLLESYAFCTTIAIICFILLVFTYTLHFIIHFIIHFKYDA